MSDIHFMYDQKLDVQEKELMSLLSETSISPKLTKNVYVLDNFVRAAAYTFVKNKPKKLEKVKERLRMSILERKPLRRVVRIPVGVEVQPVPVPSGKVSQPVHQYQEVPQYVEKVVMHPVKKPLKRKIRREPLVKYEETSEQKKELIVDRITGTILASASIADKYILTEPELNEKDLATLNRIKKKKHIKNMEKGWDLIQKYGKKEGIQQGHDTRIKYYVVNDMFGLGRIEAFLHDENITNILCEDFSKPITVEFGGKKLETNIKFGSREELMNYVVLTAQKLGKKINKKNTKVEGDMRGYHFYLDVGSDLLHPQFSIKKK